MEKGLKKEAIVEFLENLAKLINPEYIDALYLKTYQILEGMGYTTDRLMFELMQPCVNMIRDCSWLGKIAPCDSLFRVAKSSEGFCCSFNYQALKGSLEMWVYILWMRMKIKYISKYTLIDCLLQWQNQWHCQRSIEQSNLSCIRGRRKCWFEHSYWSRTRYVYGIQQIILWREDTDPWCREFPTDIGDHHHNWPARIWFDYRRYTIGHC